MKKTLVAAALTAIIASGTAWADMPPPTDEYKTIQPGILLDPAARANMQQQQAASDDSGDEQVLTHSLDVLQPQKPVQPQAPAIVTIDQVQQAYAKGKYADILQPLNTLVAQKNPQAQLILGLMYEQGQGVDKDPIHAAQLMGLAAENNVPLAQHHLAIMYYSGAGVPKDAAQAMKWLHIAIAHYPAGPEKDRAISDRKNLDAAISRKDRETAIFAAREWMAKRGETHLLDEQAAPTP